jgi:hypothetical protein
MHREHFMIICFSDVLEVHHTFFFSFSNEGKLPISTSGTQVTPITALARAFVLDRGFHSSVLL